MVSICIATYNGAKFIKEEIDSILHQISLDDEIVVSDDGSTDSTLEILESYNDKRIKIYSHTKIKAKYKFDYTTHNFGNALNHAQGDIIFMADQDDIWLPNKYSQTIKALQEADIVISDCIIVNDNLTIIHNSKFKELKPSNKVIKNLITGRNIGCCMAFKRKILQKCLPFPKYGVAQDVWISVYGSFFYSLKYINEPLLLYRRHGDNVSSTSEKSNNSIIYKISYRFRTLFELVYRRYLC